jgi:MFS family permease
MTRRGHDPPVRSPTEAGVLAAFGYPEFRRFFVGATLTQLGFWFSHMSFQALMAELTDSDSFWGSSLFAVTFLPTMIVGPFAGVLLDRVDRKRTLLLCYGTLSAIATLQAVLVAADEVTRGRLLATSFLAGLVIAVHSPATQALVANTLPPDRLRSGISIWAMGNNLCRVVGPALATPLLRAERFELTWSIYAVAGLLGVLVAWPMVVRPYEPEGTDASVLERLRSGVAHARERRPTLAALAMLAVLTIFGVSHVALLPSFTAESLGRPRGDFALVNTMAGAGALLGALAVGSLVKTVTLRGSALFAIPYGTSLLLFAVATSWPLALALQLVHGFFYFATFTSVQALVQQLVDESMRGRVSSLFTLSWAGLVPVGTFAMGLAAGGVGLDLGARRTYMVCASVCVLCAITVAIVNRPRAGAPA